MFFVGQRVVCVDDSRCVQWRPRGWLSRFRRWRRLDHNLKRGEVYRVTLVTAMTDDVSGEVVTLLHVDNAQHLGAHAVGFPHWQFRPVVERETDISVFKRLLAPKDQHKPVREDA